MPDHHTDTYAYNGLGMRLTKTDPTGSYSDPTGSYSDPTGSYSDLADGVAPASPVLSDGHTSFTPGISETVGSGSGGYASRFYLADAQGNSRGLVDGGQAATDGYNWDGFGNSISRSGTNPTGLAWGEASGYRSDADSGLRLLGHRYYESRTGRFISQDPIGDGTNWYVYCDNNPTNLTDPSGLVCPPFDSENMSIGEMYDHVAQNGGLAGEQYDTTVNGKVVFSFIVSGFSYGGMNIVAPMGQNINNDIASARRFYQSDASKSFRSIGNGQQKFMHDPKKIGDWLINNYGPGTTGDPKTKGKWYDKYGHAIYAAVGSELHLTLGTILDGEIGVHDMVHPLSPGEEENGEYAGWRYDQHYYSPGQGVWSDQDFVQSGLGFVWQHITGN